MPDIVKSVPHKSQINSYFYDLCEPIHNLQVPNATKMSYIIGYNSQPMSHRRGRNQDVGITDQFTSQVKIGIHCGSLHNHRFGERQYSARSTQLIKCLELFCCPSDKQTTQDFVSSDNGEGELPMDLKLGTRPFGGRKILAHDCR